VYIDECTRLSIDEIIDSGLLEADAGEARSLRARHGSSVIEGSLHLALRHEHLRFLALEQKLDFDDEGDDSPEPQVQVIVAERSSKRRKHRGWAFLCMREIDNEPCGRPVTALYLHPGATELGCRHCYNLSYPSIHCSDKEVRAYINNPEHLMGDFGKALMDLRLSREDPRRLGVLCEAFGELRNANYEDLTFLLPF